MKGAISRLKKLHCLQPVLLFSKLNNFFFGYFEPEIIFRDNENNIFRGALTDISAKKEALPATSELLTRSRMKQYFLYLYPLNILFELKNVNIRGNRPDSSAIALHTFSQQHTVLANMPRSQHITQPVNLPASAFVWPNYWLGHPGNYLNLHGKIIFIGSTLAKNDWFNFENKTLLPAARSALAKPSNIMNYHRQQQCFCYSWQIR